MPSQKLKEEGDFKMEPISLLALENTPKIGSKTIGKIISMTIESKPNSPSDLIELIKKANEQFKRISVPDIQAVTIGWNKAREILKRSRQKNIEIISRDSSHYPKCLLKISNPPALLHILGNIDAINGDCVAIIGTREPTKYGVDKAKNIGAFFAKKSYTVVSGLASDIDTAAHQGALEVKGLTVAVLAHGLDTVYPTKNKELVNEIIDNKGAIISEYSIGTKLNRSYFVARNRIQSGLSQKVIVVETGIEGSTMHTVKFCKEQKRELIVLKHPSNLTKHLKTQGNDILISENDGIVFENDIGIDLIAIKPSNRINDNLSNKNKNKNRCESVQITLVG